MGRSVHVVAPVRLGALPVFQAGVYDNDTMQLLGTGLSSPIRVLANNDVPTGAAYINLDVSLLCVSGFQSFRA